MSVSVIATPRTRCAESLKSVTSGAVKQRGPNTHTETSETSDLFTTTDKKLLVSLKKKKKDSHMYSLKVMWVFCFFVCYWFILFELGVGLESLLGQSPRHVFVGRLDLGVGGAGVGELVAGVGVLQVPPHARHV